jgi:hypothetical protein
MRVSLCPVVNLFRPSDWLRCWQCRDAPACELSAFGSLAIVGEVGLRTPITADSYRRERSRWLEAKGARSVLVGDCELQRRRHCASVLRRCPGTFTLRVLCRSAREGFSETNHPLSLEHALPAAAAGPYLRRTESRTLESTAVPPDQIHLHRPARSRLDAWCAPDRRLGPVQAPAN